jgi:hypothetical protein
MSGIKVCACHLDRGYLSFIGAHPLEGEAVMTRAYVTPGGWLAERAYHPMAQKWRHIRVIMSTGLVSISVMLLSDLQAIILIHPDGFKGQ